MLAAVSQVLLIPEVFFAIGFLQKETCKDSLYKLDKAWLFSGEEPDGGDVTTQEPL